VRLFLAALVALLFFGVAAVAVADDLDADLDKLETEAAEAYSDGDYERALSAMIRANQLRPHANYLLNIAVSYGKLGKCEEARRWANGALESSPPLFDKAEATARRVIARCDAAEADPGEAVGEDSGSGVEGPGAEDQDPVEVLTSLQWAGVGIGGAGLLLAGLDLLLLDLPLSSEIDDFTARNGRGEFSAGQFSSKRAELADSQTLVVMGYAVAGAMIATGVGMFVWGNDAAGGEGELSLVPLWTPNASGVQLGLRF
jgi:tetratricopeptide (TPR) repeat protein